MLIKFYTSHCTKCDVVKNLLEQKHTKYEEVDDSNIYMPIARANHICSMPFAEVNGTIMDSQELVKYIATQEEN